MATSMEPGRPYPMLRGSDQVERVSLIQYVWKQTLGYSLHPQIPSNVSRIADVATASGLWLCDLSTTNPHFERLDGYDVSDASFLPVSQRPRNVSLHAADASSPPADSARGQYDVVHVRLIQPGIREENLEKVIKHFMELLKPGGYLQWEEFDTRDFEVHVEEGQPRPSNIEKMVQVFSDVGPKAWINTLPQTLEAHGMIPIAVERKRELPWHHQQMTFLLARVMNEVATAFLDVTQPPNGGDELRAQAAGGIEEAMKGSYPGFCFQVVVAQKPGSSEGVM